MENGNRALWWAISTCLSSPNDELDPSDAFTFISIPIEDVFTIPDLSHIERLKCLESLERKYNDMVGTGGRWQNLLAADWHKEARDFMGPSPAGAYDASITITSVQSHYKEVEGCQQHDESTVDTQVGDCVPEKQTLLHWRVEEAEHFKKSACSADQHLIELYLPLLCEEPEQNILSDSLQHCQWQPPDANETRSIGQVARIINSHIFVEHFQPVLFSEIVKATFRSRSQSIETLDACTSHLHRWYQSSIHLQSNYKSIQKVRFIRA